MPILSNPAFGPRTALGYITGGLLLVIWTVVYYFAFIRPEGVTTNTARFWLLGLSSTGVVLILLGSFLGPIGRAARQVELPPPEALRTEAAIQQTAAAHPNPVVAGGVAGQAVAAPDQTMAATGQAVPGTGTTATAAPPAAPQQPTGPALRRQ